MGTAEFNREKMFERLRLHGGPWDVVVIGGGATGLGCALDAAARGYRTVLFERGDFGAGTSSRSTKLIHGGVRYLRRGQMFLVAESLRERARLQRNAPGLVRPIPIVVPTYKWWEKPWMGAGLKLYDALSGRGNMGRSRALGRERALEMLPTLRDDGLRGGVVYHDAQFDDARLAVALARTAAREGAVLTNYTEVTALLADREHITGVVARDTETGETHVVPGRVVINATGVYADAVRRMDETDAEPIIRPSRGVHIVLERHFLPGSAALLVPHTDDARVLFAIPWHDRVLVGTTDTEADAIPDDPGPGEAEIDYLLEHAGRYLVTPPKRDDITSVFAGLRPLVGTGERHDTASLSREHAIAVSQRGLVTITGGKWTTYRRMAEETVDQAAHIGALPVEPSRTIRLPLEMSSRADGDIGAVLSPDDALVHRFVDEEMARTVVDVLCRRTRALYLDARAAAAAAPPVARAMAARLGRDERWISAQIERAEQTCARHLPR